MKILRNDITIKPVPETEDKFYLEIPASHELYEFGEAQKYLIDSFRKPYHAMVLLMKFNSKFQQQVDIAYINDLISRLDNWGMMYEKERKDTGLKQVTDTVKPPEKTTVTNGNTTSPLGPNVSVVKRKAINHWSFFCPQAFLDLLAYIFGPVRHVLFLIPIIFIVAIVAFTANFQLFKQDMILVSSHFSLIKHLIFTIFTINLFCQVSRGAVARHFKIDTPSFGMMLAFGILPEFNIRIKMNESVGREARLWIFSTSLLLRILLFSGGTFLWLITRQAGTSMSIFSVALIHFSMTTFLFVGNPLMGSDGYKVLSTYLNIPKLNEKALLALKYFFFKPPEVIAKYTDKSWPLRIYGTATFLFFIAFIYFVGSTLGHWLTGYYRGFGIVVFLFLGSFVFFRHRYLAQAKKNLQAGISQDREKKSLVLNDYKLGTRSSDRSKLANFMFKIRRFKWRRTIVAIGFLCLLFIPYRYEVGGSVTVSPVLHQEIYPSDRGIVDKVYFNGGELVKKGTVIAEMDNYKQLHTIKQTNLDIIQQKETIQILLTTPSLEEIELAKKQLNVAKMQLKYSKGNADRYATLYKSESISLTSYLSAKEQMELDQMTVAEKEANLKVINNQVNKHQLESAKIELIKLQKDLIYFEAELERTKIRMPENGKIITMNLKNLEKKYLDIGSKFAEIEDSHRVQIEISIPESDADQIVIGGIVKFRAQLHPETNVMGHISLIFPTTEAVSFGTVLKVVCILPNDKYMLKTGMTGYAKIKGEKLFLYQAFTRVLRNFIYIEFWSWLP